MRLSDEVETKQGTHALCVPYRFYAARQSRVYLASKRFAREFFFEAVRWGAGRIPKFRGSAPRDTVRPGLT